MGKSKIYISIPISHFDIEERRRYAENVESALSHFYDVVNPLKNGVAQDAHPSEHMRVDFRNLLDCDAIFMCRGWEDSAGCVGEHTVARLCHITIIYEVDQCEYYR